MLGMNFTVEDKLDTGRYNKALWQGLKGNKLAGDLVLVGGKSGRAGLSD